MFVLMAMNNSDKPVIFATIWSFLALPSSEEQEVACMCVPDRKLLRGYTIQFLCFLLKATHSLFVVCRGKQIEYQQQRRMTSRRR